MAKTPKVQLKINLKDLFDGQGVDDEALRQAIGGAIIERIRDRTSSGIDKNGKALKGYSQSYKESLSFQAFGKSNQVNMTLTGDMLGTMEILRDSPGQIVIGWDDPTENAKAFNHTTGDTLPKRDFFGLPEKEISSIANEFREDVTSFNELKAASGQDFETKAVSLIQRLLGRASV